MTYKKIIFIIILFPGLFFARNAFGAGNVYYSVGQNTTDHKTGSPTLTIASGVGTFSVAQTATNMGVGDRVTYGGAVAYISGRQDTSNWTMVTATGTTPVATTSAPVTSIAHEYTSLSAAEAGMTDANHTASTTITAAPAGSNNIINIPLYYDSGADTTGVTIDGSITDATHYIRIYTATSTAEVNQSQRHSGAWSDTKYNITRTATDTITVKDNYVYIDGLQIKNTASSGAYASVLPTTATGVYISNNILWAAFVGTAFTEVQVIAPDPGTLYIWNNIMYFTGTETQTNGITSYAATIYAYNNTISGFKYNYRTQSAGSVTYAKNNISQNSVTAGYSNTGGGSFHANSTNNLSDRADAPGSNPLNSKIVTFVSSSTGNFHLASNDTSGAIDGGTSLATDPDGAISFTTDIDEQSRPYGSAWDIGADEFHCAGCIIRIKGGVEIKGGVHVKRN